MAVFVLSDLHLSTNEGTDKSMEVFGNRWKDYMNRIKNNWNRLVTPDDTVIVNGDISWAMTLEEGKSDFEFLNALNGTKIISKGNHDFWWSTVSKIEKFFKENEFNTIKLLHNNAHIAENFVICGSRGWYNDDKIASMPQNADYAKIVARESARLRASLKAADALCEEESERLVFLHFPPVWADFVCDELLSVLKEFKIKRCFFGHIHGLYSIPANFIHEGIEFIMTSADFLGFVPLFIEKRP